MPVCAPVKHNEVQHERSNQFDLRASGERDCSYSDELEKQMRMAIKQVRDGKTSSMREFLQNL